MKEGRAELREGSPARLAPRGPRHQPDELRSSGTCQPCVSRDGYCELPSRLIAEPDPEAENAFSG